MFSSALNATPVRDLCLNPGTTSNSGTVTQFYTLPPSPGTITITITITATATGVAASAVFTETAQ